MTSTLFRSPCLVFPVYFQTLFDDLRRRLPVEIRGPEDLEGKVAISPPSAGSDKVLRSSFVINDRPLCLSIDGRHGETFSR